MSKTDTRAWRAVSLVRSFYRGLREAESKACTCSGFILQYEGSCQCERGRAVSAAMQALQASLEALAAIPDAEIAGLADASAPNPPPSWRPADDPPSNSASVLIVDEEGDVDIASWRACKDNLALHWHYRRGVCAEARWWAPLPRGPK